MHSFSAQNVKNTRQKGLDFLRGLAVLLVIFRHWGLCPFLTNVGWLGVDLFFVLSGFLISGLLFSEYEKQGKIDFLRFFLRRGLKLYPLLYTLLFITACIVIFQGERVPIRALFQEAFFLQNYLGGVFVHTWSLAVEEHFYLLLMLCFGFFWIRPKTRFIYACAVFIIVPLVWRIWNCSEGHLNNHFYTHTRVDSLFAGVLAQYIFRYRKNRLGFLNSGAGFMLFLLCMALVSCFGFMPPENSFTQGIGFTLIAFSFALILLYTLQAKNHFSNLKKPFTVIGFYSYAIYLIHIPVKLVLEYVGIEETSGVLNIAYFFLYLFVCIAAGILASELIEQPLLKLRDKLLPSKA